ncbi:MAG: PH domain-containing protein [Acidobacteria bacterium]|nr:PH domain-containing protein [Acidobacteriota bacterium]
MTGESQWVWGSAAAGVFVVALLAWWIWRKSRRFADGDVFVASRFSAGNRLFPTQVLITPTSVVQYTPRWIGRQEETIHLAHVASVRIQTGALLSDVRIETTGGTDPILCHGHHKRDADRMKNLIEGYQTEYYRQGRV